MLKKSIVYLVLILIFALSATGVKAGDATLAPLTGTQLDEDYPWQYHAPPFDFSFGNMINSHQQSRLDSSGVLHGFIYIHDTGCFTEAGLPIAEKAHCPTQECRVGWVVKGVPITATLVNKGPRVWLVDPDDLPVESGYTHFHWTGAPHSPHDLVIGQKYSGYLMKRMAPEPFSWLGGSGSGGSGSGGCDGHISGCDGGTGGCSGGDMGGCSGCDTGGCSGGGEMGGGGAGHGGRLVPEGLDSHSNIVTVWNGTWHGGGCDD